MRCAIQKRMLHGSVPVHFPKDKRTDADLDICNLCPGHAGDLKHLRRADITWFYGIAFCFRRRICLI